MPPLQMRRSTVVGGDGKSVQDNIRTSYGTFLRQGTEHVLNPLAKVELDFQIITLLL